MVKRFGSREEFKKRLIQAVGQALITRIAEKSEQLGLWDTGFYANNWNFKLEGDAIILTNNAPYAKYLEWGTFEYVFHFGGGFPKRPHPKKKDISKALRKQFPKGMQPFATVRRVLHNPHEMEIVLKRAMSSL